MFLLSVKMFGFQIFVHIIIDFPNFFFPGADDQPRSEKLLKEKQLSWVI